MDADRAILKLLAAAVSDSLLDGWASQIKPMPLDEIPTELWNRLPDYDDSKMDGLEYPAVLRPLSTKWVPLAPPQRPAPRDAPACPRPRDLYQEAGRLRVSSWFASAWADMADVAEQLARQVPFADITRHLRPKPIAVGQAEMARWARGLVWDCRQPCCRPLDYAAPFSSDLDLDFIGEELAAYPDQTLVAYLTEGVRLDADVELQTVLVPHLTSLPGGFASVGRELRRLKALGWYNFFDQMPFVPGYAPLA